MNLVPQFNNNNQMNFNNLLNNNNNFKNNNQYNINKNNNNLNNNMNNNNHINNLNNNNNFKRELNFGGHNNNNNNQKRTFRCYKCKQELDIKLKNDHLLSHKIDEREKRNNLNTGNVVIHMRQSVPNRRINNREDDDNLVNNVDNILRNALHRNNNINRNYNRNYNNNYNRNNNDNRINYNRNNNNNNMINNNRNNNDFNNNNRHNNNWNNNRNYHNNRILFNDHPHFYPHHAPHGIFIFRMQRNRSNLEHKHEIHDFPEMTIEDVNKLEESNRRCVICLEDFYSGEKITALPCVHFFHKQCIKNWIKKQKNCPICKFELTEENLNQKIRENENAEA
jgi:hypothetical protein